MINNLGRVAIIADQMTAFGGADREMLSVLRLMPEADIYTVLYNPSGYTNIDIKQNIYTSFVQKLPFKYKFSKHLKVLNPIAYENFDLREYDTLISISAGPAKGVIPDINQIHIAMVMTPPRSLWDHELNIRASKLKNLYKPISKVLNNYERIWDTSLVPRIDYWIANSNFISKKIMKRYHVKSEVIYPGIEEECFESFSKSEIDSTLEKYSIPRDFILVVSRLYDYKRIDWAIKSAIDTGKNLVIIGDGPDRKYLKKLSKGHSNIYFLGFLQDDREVRIFYKQAQLLLFCGIEDFGLVPVEAMAQGTPIFAYDKGGVTETVLENETGEFFKDNQELTKLLNDFSKKGYNEGTIINRAREFSEKNFLNNLNQYLETIHE
ncbi:MAG: glycosyltransferase [Candidatus Dojkabacteria bacterium]|jgi:glycosyltransferase involved in cell wall biosynthesis|nr:glycosyltransferase [Candidatus Dojkabacteria bacterium]MDD2270372.1 glycosyltransferase [Candidatus Dojkabacteria bacterium]